MDAMTLLIGTYAFSGLAFYCIFRARRLDLAQLTRAILWLAGASAAGLAFALVMAVGLHYQQIWTVVPVFIPLGGMLACIVAKYKIEQAEYFERLRSML